MYFFCLNQLNLSKYTTLEHKKHNLSPENCLLEIQASTFEGPFIYNEASSHPDKFLRTLGLQPQISSNSEMSEQCLFNLSWRFLRSNKMKLEKKIGIQKHAGKLGKCFFATFRISSNSFRTSMYCYQRSQTVHKVKFKKEQFPRKLFAEIRYIDFLNISHWFF